MVQRSTYYCLHSAANYFNKELIIASGSGLEPETCQKNYTVRYSLGSRTQCCQLHQPDIKELSVLLILPSFSKSQNKDKGK